MKKALIVLAEGFEEIEAVTPIDCLRRAGIEVTVAGLETQLVVGAHGVTFQTDKLLKDWHELPDLLILPGGAPGAKHLAGSSEVSAWIKKMNEAGRLIGAICAAPAWVLAPSGVLDGKRATCYPGCEESFSPAIHHSTDRVVVDGNCITSQGPGSALEFALTLVGCLLGKPAADKLAKAMLERRA